MSQAKHFYLAFLIAGAVTSVAILTRTSPLRAPSPVPAASSIAAATPKTDVVDTRTGQYATYNKENDRWLRDRDEFAKNCAEHNGVPVFTFGLRVVCIARSALVDHSVRGIPDRASPEPP